MRTPHVHKDCLPLTNLFQNIAPFLTIVLAVGVLLMTECVSLNSLFNLVRYKFSLDLMEDFEMEEYLL